MAENSQLSDETKPEATDSSSTQPGSQAIDMNHTNAIVPHQISNHDKLVQTMVMVDGEWVNINDTNDQKNVQEDMHKVNRVVTEAQKDIINAQNAADSAVKSADSAISASKVNSDAIVAQGEAISEAKNALDSATAEIQLTASNAASDAASIRADVAKVESEVASAKSASQNSVNALQSDIDAAKKDLADAHSGLLNAQAAIDQNNKLINDSVAKINNDIEQDRKDLAAAQQANSDTAAQLSDYAKQAADQGKTIKSLQDDGSSMKATIADINGNVSQVQDSVSGLSASLKDTQGNLATVKGLADSLNATITDHSKNISALQATAQSLSSTLSDADGRLSKVEQTAKEQSTTLSTVQGDLSQVKQTADGLTDTLKDAQGDIASVQATAKGLSEQVTNAQGAITSLQTDVTGIKATITDHENDIHTLQADAKSLTDKMTDAQGNISSLQKTATSLDSEFKDHSGRLSKVEQTASTLTNELSDEQGHLNRVEQTANGTQQTVADHAGNIATLQAEAKTLTSQMSSAQGNISTLQQTASGISSKVSGMETSLADANSKIDGITSNGGGRNLLRNSNVELHGKAYDFAYPILTVDHLEAGETYTMSWYGKVDANATKHKQTLIAYVYTQDWSWSADGTTPYTANEYQRNVFTFTVPKDVTNAHVVTFYLSHYNGDNSQAQHDKDDDAGIGYAKNYMLEKGTVAHDWQPAPEDTDAKITTNTAAIDQNKKAIALKADQSAVDNLTGEVSQNKAQLKVQADQISSKVSSTDFKTLNDRFNNMKVGGRNLLHGTSDQWRTLTGSGWLSSSTASDVYTSVADYHDGDQFTYSAIITNSSTVPVRLVLYCYGTNKQRKIKTVVGQPVKPGAGAVAVSITITTDWQTWFLRSNIETVDGEAPQISIQAKEEKLEAGNTATAWAPNPDDLITSISKNSTAIDQTNKQISLKADQTEVDTIKGTASQNSSRLDTMASEIQSKVTSTDVNNIVDGKGYATANTVQSLINQKAGTLNESITKLSNDTVTQLQQVTASVDGLQSSVANKADESQVTQLSNLVQSKVSSSDFNSKITQLANDINLRVTKGDLISQINLEAGGDGLISVQNGKGKLMLDADSVVFGNKAFIPSAAITNIQADQITTGTLDAAKLNVTNFSANNITGGTLDGIKFKTELMNDDRISIMGDRIAWTSNTGFGEQLNGWIDNSVSETNWLSLRDIRLQSVSEVGIDTQNTDDITRWSLADYDHYDQPGLMVSNTHKFIPEESKYDDTASADQSNAVLLASNNTYVAARRGTGILAHLDSKNFANSSMFAIQKDDKIGFYVGGGDNGNLIDITTTGTGNHISVNTYGLDVDGEVSITNDHGLTAKNVHVTGWLGVDGSKNSIVKTSQGTVAINAYETAEYYFGDIGEGQTGANGIAYIGIEKLFNETVNTSIPYQVFITAYGPGNIWVEQREQDRFVVKSDQSNVKFGWEIKAKRKGYENTRLQNVDNELKHMEATS